MIRIVVLGLVFQWVCCISGCRGNEAQGRSEPKGPIAAATPLGADLSMRPGASDRCPVCAMTTADKKLPAGISLKDGRTFYFCGPGCMIKAWLDPETHLGVDTGALEKAVATEFLTGKSIDAEQAVWVMGSDVVGPMGPMPVPLTPENEAAFTARHGGKMTFRLKEMTKEKWAGLKKAPQK